MSGDSARLPADNRTLAESLRDGPLPLSTALQCSADVAQALKELHGTGRAHGQLLPANVVIAADRCELRLPESPPASIDLQADVAALGALIYEAVTGVRPTSESPPTAPRRVPGPRSHPDALRADALRIAARCLGTPENQDLDLAKASAELRVLAVLARQNERTPKAQPIPVPTPHGLPPAAIAKVPPVTEPEPVAPTVFLKQEKTSAAALPAPNLPQWRRCPECGSADLHDSKPSTRLEKLLVFVFRIPLYRCHQCYHRWFLLFRAAIPCKPQKVHRRSF